MVKQKLRDSITH